MATQKERFRLRKKMDDERDKKIIKESTSAPLKRRQEYKDAIARQSKAAAKPAAKPAVAAKGMKPHVWAPGEEAKHKKALAAYRAKKGKPAVAAKADVGKKLSVEEMEAASERGFGEVSPRAGSRDGKALAKYSAKAGPRKKVRAKSGTKRLGAAPPLPKNWRKLKVGDPIRKRYRDWAAGKLDTRKAVAKGKSKGFTVDDYARGKGPGEEYAEARGLEARIAMKIKNKEPIPKAWQKKMQARGVRAGVEAAGRRIRGTVLVGSKREKEQKAKIKGATAGMREIMKTISPQARARYAKGQDIAETVSEQAEHKARQGRVATATAKRTTQDKIASIRARKSELQAKLARQKEERKKLTATQTTTPKGY